jgi:hypothetical protein
MYSGDPQRVSAREVVGRILAKPKSAILSIGSDSIPVAGRRELAVAARGIRSRVPLCE